MVQISSRAVCFDYSSRGRITVCRKSANGNLLSLQPCRHEVVVCLDQSLAPSSQVWWLSLYKYSTNTQVCILSCFIAQMARYLTPAKISLLALIELYAEAVVPEAATVPVLSFVIAHLLPFNLPMSRENRPGTESSDGSQTLFSAKDLEKLLGPHPAASGVPGRSLWDLLVKKLWDIDSLDALHIFFERISHLLAKTHEEIQKDSEIGIPPPSPEMIVLSRTSPFGSFVRRSQLEFTHLKFHDAVELWKSFVAYRQATLPQWRRRNPGADNWGFDSVLQTGDIEWGDGALESFAYITYGDIVHHPEKAQGFVSTDDMDSLLEFQVEQMQSRQGLVSSQGI